jgi:dTDP-glucose 4,6-dehydratase
LRIVITGGAGFIGSHLCDRFIDEGHEVVCLDSYITGRPNNVEHLLSHPRFRLVECDVCESCSVEGPVDRVLHMASPASPKGYLENPLATLKVGSLGTLNALELARQNDARFLLASTSEVYGDPLEHPQRETYWGNVNPIGPRSVYDEAKRFAESLTMAYHRKHRLQTRIVRIFNTYGPRMKTSDGRALPAFMSQALRGKPVTVFGSGEQTRSFCYVSDLVEGICRLLESDYVEPINIGNPDEMTILQLAREVVELVGGSGGIEFEPLPQDDPQLRRPDITRARDILNWEPKVTREVGLRRTLEYFRQQLTLHQPQACGHAGE